MSTLFTTDLSKEPKTQFISSEQLLHRSSDPAQQEEKTQHAHEGEPK